MHELLTDKPIVCRNKSVSKYYETFTQMIITPVGNTYKSFLDLHFLRALGL